MKNKVINGLGAAIALLYTLLIFLSIGGLDRGSIINRFFNLFNFINDSIFSAALLAFSMTVLVFYYILMSRVKCNYITVTIYFSFAIGVVFFVLVTQINLVHKYLFNCYISWFYHSVYYEGEEKVPQVFLFILRLFTLCFCCGSVISIVAVKLLKRN